MSQAQPLAVLTRPKGRNTALAASLLERRWSVLECPALDIQYLHAHVDEVPRPEAFDLIVFVSRAAVTGYCRQLACVGALRWPSQTLTACVGSSTATAIREAFGKRVVVVHPASTETQDSEALLPLLLKRTQPLKKVLIVRGQEGREWLGQRLLAQGVQVSFHQAYLREPAQWNEALQAQLQTFKRQGMQATWLLTSVQGVAALQTQLESHGLLEWFSQGQFILTHDRVKTALCQITGQPLNSENCAVANPEDQAILACFERFAMKN